jgi:hypothetical protein
MTKRVRRKEIDAGTAKTAECNFQLERDRSAVNMTEYAMKG